MAYITVSLDNGEFKEFNTANKDDKKVLAWLGDRDIERALSEERHETARRDILDSDPDAYQNKYSG